MTTAATNQGTPRGAGPRGANAASGLVSAYRAVYRFCAEPLVHLFVASILAGLTLAVITGPDGSNSAPTSGFSASLSPPRVWWFIGFGVVLFVVRATWGRLGTVATTGARSAKGLVLTWLATAWVRVVLESALVAIGFLWVSAIAPHDTWKGGLCVQLGAAMLAMEVVVALRQRFSPRIGRVAAYGFVAGYGALADLTGATSRYLNRINVVPHNPVLGRFLMVLALGLTTIELLAYLLGKVHRLVERKVARNALAVVGAAVVVYGWLTWTTWAQWRATQPGTVAHFLASHHLLIHSETEGVAIMAVGAALVAAALVWLLVDVAVAARSGRPAKQVEQLGFERVGKVSLGKSAAIIAALLLALEWPLHMDPASLSNINSSILPFVLLALGLNVVIGYAGLLDLGYVAFYAIGAYTSAYFTHALAAHPPFVLDTFWSIPFAIGAAMLAGVLLGTPTLRLRGDYLAIVTLGFGEIIYIFANNLSFTGGAQGAQGSVPPFSFHLLTPLLNVSQNWSGNIYVPYYYLLLGVVVVSMIGFSLLEHSKVGRSWSAIREDEVAADSLGVNALKYKVMAFAIGASTGGMAGVFLASQFGTLFPQDFAIQISIIVVVCVVFGGMGSIPGAVVGGIVIGGMGNYLQQHTFFSWYNPSDYYIYLGAILVVMMIFRPQGIVPSRRRRREIALTESGMQGGGFSSSVLHGLDASLARHGPIDAELE